jgi:hypothetical protein
MPYNDVKNLVTVTKRTVKDEMTCGYGSVRNHSGENTAPSLPQTCTKISAAPNFDYPISQIL